MEAPPEVLVHRKLVLQDFYGYEPVEPVAPGFIYHRHSADAVFSIISYRLSSSLPIYLSMLSMLISFHDGHYNTVTLSGAPLAKVIIHQPPRRRFYFASVKDFKQYFLWVKLGAQAVAAKNKRVAFGQRYVEKVAFYVSLGPERAGNVIATGWSQASALSISPLSTISSTKEWSFVICFMPPLLTR